MLAACQHILGTLKAMRNPMMGSLARGPKVLGHIPLNTDGGTSHERPTPTLWGYLDLLEVHRLANELVILGQLLAGRQLDEHLTELTSTTTARGHSGHHSQVLPTGTAPIPRGSLHCASLHCWRIEGEKVKANLGVLSCTCAVLRVLGHS